MEHAPAQRLEIDIYQLVDDALLRKNRADGTGWDWSWADWRRGWMDASANKFAYRCLPLTIANQIGWWVFNPVGFTAVWYGRPDVGAVQFYFDADPALWSQVVSNHFGLGVVTWKTPLLFRTRPAGSRLLVTGPANTPKNGIQPLTAVIESDWMTMSFTMNWMFTADNLPVRFEAGEPLFQVIPLAGNVGADLENAAVTYRRLADDPDLARAYHEWSDGREAFHAQKARGEVGPDDWQKDYFRGRDAARRESPAGHMTKVVPPKITDLTGGAGGS